LDTLILIHDRLSNAVILYMVAVGAWGMFAYFRGEDLGGSLGGSFIIGQLLIIAQAVFGLILVFMGGRPLENLHYVYGAVCILLLPFAYTFVRDRYPRTGLLLCSSAALFIAVLAFRAIATGS
jgi:heme A synthase